MSIIFDTFLGVFSIKVKFFKYFFIKLIFDRHFLFSWEIAHISISIFNLKRPGMISNVVNCESSFWISVQYSSDQVLALARKEFWESILGAHNLFVKIRSFWILEGKIATDHGIKDNTTAPNISS